MPFRTVLRPDRESRLLRLRTLLRLRWFVIIGQALAVFGVHVGLGLPLPMGAIAVVLALGIASNIVLHTRFPRIDRMEEGAAFLILAAEILQLTALLYLTGGIENPFAILLLAPVLISATVLPPRRTVMLGALAMICSTVVAIVCVPLQWFGGTTLTLPAFYSLGQWLAIQVAIVFIGGYAGRIAKEARQLVDALAATELVLEREQHLHQLDGLAAAAAHELGTPLATIALVAKELLNGKLSHEEMRADLALIKEQSDRSKQILAEIPALGSAQFSPMGMTTISRMVGEVAERNRPKSSVQVALAAQGEGPEPPMPRSPAMMYGISNLVQNAIAFAATTVTLDIRWNQSGVVLEVGDDGPGIPDHVLNNLGEPYIAVRRSVPAEPGGVAHAGMGLGLFIARMLLERSGASLEARNRLPPDRGATIRLMWPMRLFEAGLRNGQEKKAAEPHAFTP